MIEKKHLSEAYHKLFLGMSVASFIFGLVAAAAGIIFIFLHPDKLTAGIMIEAVSLLGFFFARWCQSRYAPFLCQTAQTERANDLLQYDEFLQDPAMRRAIADALLGDQGPLFSGMRLNEQIQDYNPKKYEDVLKEPRHTPRSG